MLKSKLTRSSSSRRSNNKIICDNISPYFTPPFWSKFYNIEVELNVNLREVALPSHIVCVYNPIEYAADLHCAYLRKFLKGPKRLVFVGMNPGPNGMAQTGVPFGNIKTVKELMDLQGSVQQPSKVHPNRPVTGLNCSIEEPSGVRFWGILNKLSDGLDNYSRQCFMHNFCPLAFFDLAGKNITPSELKGEARKIVRHICLNFFEKELELLNPSVVVAVGGYVYDSFKPLAAKYTNIKFLKLIHPSPRSPHNADWPKKAEVWLKENDLIKYLQNEA